MRKKKKRLGEIGSQGGREGRKCFATLLFPYVENLFIL